jgi:hypothetical protein
MKISNIASRAALVEIAAHVLASAALGVGILLASVSSCPFWCQLRLNVGTLTPTSRKSGSGRCEQPRSVLLAERSWLPFRAPSLSQAWRPAFEHRAASFASSSTCRCRPHQISFQCGCRA